MENNAMFRSDEEVMREYLSKPAAAVSYLKVVMQEGLASEIAEAFYMVAGIYGIYGIGGDSPLSEEMITNIVKALAVAKSRTNARSATKPAAKRKRPVKVAA